MRLRKNQRDKEIAAIVAQRDSDIDTSEMPEITDWSVAVVGKFYRGTRTSVLCLDDVLPARAPVTLRTMTPQRLILECSRETLGAWNEFVGRWGGLIRAVVKETKANLSPALAERLIRQAYASISTDHFMVLRQVNWDNDNAFLEFLAYLKGVAQNTVLEYIQVSGAAAGVVDAALPSDTLETVESVNEIEFWVLVEEADRILRLTESDTQRRIFWAYFRRALTAGTIADFPFVKHRPKGVKMILRHLAGVLKPIRGERAIQLLRNDLNQDMLEEALRERDSERNK